MIYINKQGHRVETDDDTADPVAFCVQGGGYVCRMMHRRFHAEFAPAPTPTYRAGTVTAEWLKEGVSYPCYSNGDRWNGWGMPYFTKDTVTDLLRAMQDDAIQWVDGKLMHADPQEDEPCEITPLLLPGVEPLYGLGAGNWCWDSVDFDDEKTPPARQRL